MSIKHLARSALNLPTLRLLFHGWNSPALTRSKRLAGLYLILTLISCCTKTPSQSIWVKQFNRQQDCVKRLKAEMNPHTRDGNEGEVFGMVCAIIFPTDAKPEDVIE